MTPDDAIRCIRFLDHQAKECRGRDASEALCLLLPAMLRVLGVKPMDDFEAAAFRHGFKRDLDALPDRLAVRQALAKTVVERQEAEPQRMIWYEYFQPPKKD